MKSQNKIQKNGAQLFHYETKRCFAIVLMLFVFSLFGKVNAQAPQWQMVKAISGTGGLVGGYVNVDDYGNIYSFGAFDGTIDLDPGVGVLNYTETGTGYDIYILKLDKFGNLLWGKTIGSPAYENGYTAIQIDKSGNIYFQGVTNGTLDVDPGSGVFNISKTSPFFYKHFICKYDSNGNFIWAKTHDRDQDGGDEMEIDTKANVISAGYFYGTIDFNPGPGIHNLTSAGGQDIYVYKLDSAGDFKWAHRFGSGGSDHGFSVTTDNSDNVYVSGSFSGTVDFDPGPGVFNLVSKGGEDIFVLKLSSTGNLIWARAMGGSSTERAKDVSIDAFGNVGTTGSFGGTVDFDPGAAVFNITANSGNSSFISMLDSSGSFIWAKAKPGAGIRYFSDFDAAGNVYTYCGYYGTVDLDPGAGVFNVTSQGGEDCYVAKLDNAGNFVWGKSIGGSSTDESFSLVCDPTGQMFITIFSPTALAFDTITVTNNGSYDTFIAKLNGELSPCSNTNCNINPSVTATNVYKENCNNGKIIVQLGTGLYQVFPHVELYDAANNLLSTVDLPLGTADYTFTDLVPGHYMVKVADDTCCQLTFYAKVKCRAPSSGLTTTNITATSAQLNWNLVSCADGYRVQYRQQGAATWINKGVNTNIGLKSITALQPNTTYEWKVTTHCVGLAAFEYPGYYSAISTFTTAALRLGETQSTLPMQLFDISLYPNPATNTVTINFETENAAALLQVVNTAGQVVYKKQLNNAEGNFEELIDISNLNSGVYMLLVKTEQGIGMKKFIKK